MAILQVLIPPKEVAPKAKTLAPPSSSSLERIDLTTGPTQAPQQVLDVLQSRLALEQTREAHEIEVRRREAETRSKEIEIQHMHAQAEIIKANVFSEQTKVLVDLVQSSVKLNESVAAVLQEFLREKKRQRKSEEQREEDVES